jgi:type VI secretion system protein VasD
MRAPWPNGSSAAPQDLAGPSTSHAAQVPALLLLFAGLMMTLAGCGSPPPPPPAPTVADIRLTVSNDANATQSGEGAPIIVRVYQLASTTGFEQAEFFRLLDADARTLGSDLVKKEEYLLAPGTKKSIAATVPESVTAIGVFAAYREFLTKPWRVTVPVPPHKTTPVAVEITAAGLRIAPAP